MIDTRTHYRIVRSNLLGYDVQRWVWYWPVWTTFGQRFHFSVRHAEQYLEEHRQVALRSYVDGE